METSGWQFIWSLTATFLYNLACRHLQWESRFQALVSFKEQYGHTQVPINWEENIQLANWVSTQRQEYQNMLKGRTTRLDEKRIRLLDGVGFSWQLPRGGRKRHLQPANQEADRENVARSAAVPAASTNAASNAAKATPEGEQQQNQGQGPVSILGKQYTDALGQMQMQNVQGSGNGTATGPVGIAQQHPAMHILAVDAFYQ